MSDLSLRMKQAWQTRLDGEILYFFAFVLYFFFSFIRNTTFNPYIGARPFNLVSYMVVGLLVIKIYIFDRQQLKSVFLTTIGLGIAVVSWRMSGSNLIIVMMAFILGARNISFKKIIKWYFWLGTVMLFMVMFFSLTGVIQNMVFVAKGRVPRYALGIIYPTDFAAHVLYLVLAHSYLNYESLNVKYYITYFIVASITMLVTNARLSFICLLLTIPVLWIAKHAELEHRPVAKLVASLYWTSTPLLAVITFFATYLFDNTNHIFYMIDHLLSGRLSYGNMSLWRYPITFWGQKVIEHGHGGSAGMKVFNQHDAGYFYIDSSYMRLIMIYGLVVAVIMVGIFMAISIRETSAKRYVIPAILFIVSISCMVEQHLLELTYNPFLLALFAEVGTNKALEEKTIEKQKL